MPLTSDDYLFGGIIFVFLIGIALGFAMGFTKGEQSGHRNGMNQGFAAGVNFTCQAFTDSMSAEYTILETVTCMKIDGRRHWWILTPAGERFAVSGWAD